MSTRKSWIIWSLCFLLLSSVIVAGVFQHGAIARATSERQALLKDSEEVDRFTQENADLDQLRSTNQALAEFRSRQRDLARFRNEVSQLRTQGAEAARLRIENQQMVSSQKGGGAAPANFVTREKMADAGLGTPEAAVQTIFFAMIQGDIKRLMQCQSTEEQMTPEQEKEQGDTFRRHFANFPGFMISETKIISPDEEELGVQSSPGGVVIPVHLIRTGNDWKVKQ